MGMQAAHLLHWIFSQPGKLSHSQLLRACSQQLCALFTTLGACRLPPCNRLPYILVDTGRMQGCSLQAFKASGRWVITFADYFVRILVERGLSFVLCAPTHC